MAVKLPVFGFHSSKAIQKPCLKSHEFGCARILSSPPPILSPVPMALALVLRFPKSACCIAPPGAVFHSAEPAPGLLVHQFGAIPPCLEGAQQHVSDAFD